MLLFYINLGEGNPPYPTLLSAPIFHQQEDNDRGCSPSLCFVNRPDGLTISTVSFYCFRFDDHATLADPPRPCI